MNKIKTKINYDNPKKHQSEWSGCEISYIYTLHINMCMYVYIYVYWKFGLSAPTKAKGI